MKLRRVLALVADEQSAGGGARRGAAARAAPGARASRASAASPISRFIAPLRIAAILARVRDGAATDRSCEYRPGDAPSPPASAPRPRSPSPRRRAGAARRPGQGRVSAPGSLPRRACAGRCCRSRSWQEAAGRAGRDPDLPAGPHRLDVARVRRPAVRGAALPLWPGMVQHVALHPRPCEAARSAPVEAVSGYRNPALNACARGVGAQRPSRFLRARPDSAAAADAPRSCSSGSARCTPLRAGGAGAASASTPSPASTSIRAASAAGARPGRRAMKAPARCSSAAATRRRRPAAAGRRAAAPCRTPPPRRSPVAASARTCAAPSAQRGTSRDSRNRTPARCTAIRSARRISLGSVCRSAAFGPVERPSMRLSR